MHERKRAEERAKTDEAGAQEEDLTLPLEEDDEFWWQDAHDGWSGIRKRTPTEPPPSKTEEANRALASRPG